jgi:hypothetical protein
MELEHIIMYPVPNEELTAHQCYDFLFDADPDPTFRLIVSFQKGSNP